MPKSKTPATDGASVVQMHNHKSNVQATLDGVYAEIAALADSIGKLPGEQRKSFLTIGDKLVKARNVCPHEKAFGEWVLASGLAALPGLDTAAKRSDTIWAAEHRACVSLIPEKIGHPRGWRQAWRRLFVKEVADAADAVLNDVAGPDGGPNVPAVEAAASDVVTLTHAEYDEAYAAIIARCDAVSDGTAEAEDLEAAGKTLERALDKALEAGMEQDAVAARATFVMGGVFDWSPEGNTPEKVLSACSDETFAKELVKRTGGNMAAIAKLAVLGGSPG